MYLEAITKVDVATLTSALYPDAELGAVNTTFRKLTNISSFFGDKSEVEAFAKSLSSGSELSLVREAGRQFGDYQTPPELADEVCRLLGQLGCAPSVVIEPTCGEGSFMEAALDHFGHHVRHIYGVEIQSAYVHAAKLRLLHRSLAFGKLPAQVSVIEDDIFTHDFPEELVETLEDELLILGNPPWVTNAELGSLASSNLPRKRNIKGYSGLDAMTGKSNFDISEYILLRLLDLFHTRKGFLALLCKNSVIRNLVRELSRRKYYVSDMRAYGIDAGLHFGASVEASLLFLRLGEAPESNDYVCSVYESLSSVTPASIFGWSETRFVSNVETYTRRRAIDGKCQYTWRQGLKHDCSMVMELTRSDGHYRNKIGEAVELEDDCVFPLLKSSDVKGFSVTRARLHVPVTQKYIGEDTSYIERVYPKLWSYLIRHKSRFAERKSSIYRGKPDFSIFGIGDYSFSPYKVAISGFYKAGSFTLVGMIDGKPVMFDDTCYFLGFDSYKDALFVCTLLNSEPVQDFLKSIVFSDAKRPYTKEILMRIDLRRALEQVTFRTLNEVWGRHDYHPVEDVSESDFQAFLLDLQGDPLQTGAVAQTTLPW